VSGPLRGVAASTVTGSTASIKVGEKTVTAQVARGLTLAVNDPVLVVPSGSSWYVAARLYASASTPPTNDTALNPQPASRSGSLICQPIETRTYQSTPATWNTGLDSTYQGNFGGLGDLTGCAFYGTKPTSLHGATVTSASVQLQRLVGGATSGAALTLNKVTQSTRPAGAPTLTASTAGPTLTIGETDSAFAVPTAWVQAMVDGTAGGLAIYDSDGTPYARLAGVADWSAAWTLTINWTRS